MLSPHPALGAWRLKVQGVQGYSQTLSGLVPQIYLLGALGIVKGALFGGCGWSMRLRTG